MQCEAALVTSGLVTERVLIGGKAPHALGVVFGQVEHALLGFTEVATDGASKDIGVEVKQETSCWVCCVSVLDGVICQLADGVAAGGAVLLVSICYL